jgi:hypothetical protein
MATIQCPNPQCKTKSTVADGLLGKKVRCKICDTPFVASAVTGESVTAAPPQRAGPGPKLKTSTGTVAAVPTVPAAPAAPLAVVVRRTGDGTAGGSTIWCVAALLAFVLPITAAVTFVALNWKAEVGEGGPASVERFGGIEIASKGVKFVVFEVFPEERLGYDYREIAKGSSATNLVTGLKETGRFDAQALKATAKAAGKFVEHLQEKHGLPLDRIVIVGSSGLFEALDDRPADERARLVSQNKDRLVKAVGEVIAGRGVRFLDVEEEVKHALRAWVPTKYRDAAVVIDVGSGATRGGYQDAAGIRHTFTMPGIKSFGKQIKAKPQGRESLSATADRLAPRALHEPLQRHIERAPGLRSHDRVYLGGGVVWVLATCQHPADQEGSYVKLTVADINDFADRLRKDPDFLKTFRPPADLDEKKREAVSKQVAKMQENFLPEELVAGAEVLRTLVTELKLDRKELAWYRRSDNTGLMSFVAEKSGFHH